MIVAFAHVATPPHPARFAYRPLPARGERLELGSVQRHHHLSPRAGRGRLASLDARRVRGRLRRQRGRYDFQYAGHVAQDIVVPEAQHSIVVIFEPFVANRVARIVGMLSAINFNNETTLAADQVDRIGSDRLLADELVTIERPRPESISQSGFGFRGIPSQSSGAFGLKLSCVAHVATPPHPARFACRPLPARGERLSPVGAR
jgi:hypothetical protein